MPYSRVDSVKRGTHNDFVQVAAAKFKPTVLFYPSFLSLCQEEPVMSEAKKNARKANTTSPPPQVVVPATPMNRNFMYSFPYRFLPLWCFQFYVRFPRRCMRSLERKLSFLNETLSNFELITISLSKENAM